MYLSVFVENSLAAVSEPVQASAAVSEGSSVTSQLEEAVSSVASEVSSAASQAANAAQNNGVWTWLGPILLWGGVILLAYFLFIRPSKKRQKQEEDLRNSIEIGDDVTTIGGIVGRIISVKDDDETFIIETGSDKTRMRFKKWAIASVDTPEKQPKKPEPKEDKAEDKPEKPKKEKKEKKKRDEE